MRSFNVFPSKYPAAFFTSSSKAEVVDYSPSRDLERVSKIAADQLPALTSNWSINVTRKDSVISEILPIIESPHTYKKVLRIGNETIGFITYWENKKRTLCGKQALILHLAVDRQWHKNGYGSMLLEETVKHLEKEGADFVELLVTSDDPIPFYQKHKFIIINHPNSSPPVRVDGKMVLFLNDSSSTACSRLAKKVYMHRPINKQFGFLYALMGSLTVYSFGLIGRDWLRKRNGRS